MDRLIALMLIANPFITSDNLRYNLQNIPENGSRQYVQVRFIQDEYAYGIEIPVIDRILPEVRMIRNDYGHIVEFRLDYSSGDLYDGRTLPIYRLQEFPDEEVQQSPIRNDRQKAIAIPRYF